MKPGTLSDSGQADEYCSVSSYSRQEGDQQMQISAPDFPEASIFVPEALFLFGSRGIIFVRCLL